MILISLAFVFAEDAPVFGKRDSDLVASNVKRDEGVAIPDGCTCYLADGTESIGIKNEDGTCSCPDSKKEEDKEMMMKMNGDTMNIIIIMITIMMTMMNGDITIQDKIDQNVQDYQISLRMEVLKNQ